MSDDNCVLSDRDYMNNLLSYLKEMVKNYSVCLTEVSLGELYEKYKAMFDVYSSLHREVFEYMLDRGWYNIEVAECDKISKKHKMLLDELNDLK